MGGILGVSTPGGESNAVCVTRHLQAVKGAVCILFAFDRADDHTIPPVVGGDFGVKAFKSQLGAHGFRLLGAFEGAALHHPATFIFFLCRLFWRFRFTRDRRGLLRFRLRSRGVRRRLQQVLIRLLGCRLFRLLRLAWLLCRCSLRRTRLLLLLLVRLLRYAWLRTRLLNRLGVSPLLLLYLLLCLTLALQCLLTLFRRLLVPRHFVKLGRLLAHIRLHLRQ